MPRSSQPVKEKPMQTANDAAIENSASNKWLSQLAFMFYFAFLKLLVHIIFSSGYGYFRDELNLLFRLW
jgi:hypothetical protein